MPYKDLAFSGVPNKSLVTLLPNAYCLASVIELPFFVITLDEVELVHFERVQLSIKNFDMVFVFKDLNRQAHRITTIPMESLEVIKSWLDSVDILYSEGTINLKWPNILAKIKNDPEAFIKEGGWSFLHDGGDDSEDNDEENEDSSFDDDEGEDEEESEFSEESEEYEDSEVSGGDDELSEEGLSWDKLEEKAEKMDREHFKNQEKQET
jgi:nucleosome binding factor SPN SPT16 subunit